VRESRLDRVAADIIFRAGGRKPRARSRHSPQCADFAITLGLGGHRSDITERSGARHVRSTTGLYGWARFAAGETLAGPPKPCREAYKKRRPRAGGEVTSALVDRMKKQPGRMTLAFAMAIPI
jgi:hypothetical protein